jgi:hypothetical protein
MGQPRRSGGCTRETARCDFWNWGVGSTRPPCCTEHLLELLGFVHELLEENRIVHWVDYGTLLGAVRDSDLIAWDEDVDLGALEADAGSILALKPEIEAAGYAVSRPEPAVIRVNYSATNETNLDLFLWQEEDDMLKGDFDPSYDWPGVRGHRFPKRYVAKLEPVRIGELSLPAPAPVDRFLIEHRYGPDYMTPAHPILRVWLCPEIPPEAMTPRVKEMLAAISEKDHRLSELSTRTRFARTRLSRLWQEEAIPLSPPRAAKARLLAEIPLEERSETVDHLAGSIAWLDRANQEFGNPTAISRARQLGRFGFRRAYTLLGRISGKKKG